MTVTCRKPANKLQWEDMDPDRVASLARFLRKCKSTPDLSCTAVSLLSKTLTARATRLESSASRARIAEAKETYRTATLAKRRRASGPKNVSEFMRRTIRGREKAQENSRTKDQSRSFDKPQPLDTVGRPSKSLFQTRKGSLRATSGLPHTGGAYTCCSQCSTPVPLAHCRPHRRARSAGARRRHIDSSPNTKKGHPLQLDPKTPSVSGTWNLENDEDIRILLNRAPSRVSNIRPSTAGAESNFRGSSGGGDTRSTPTRPSSSGPSVPSRTKPESRQDNNPRPADCRGCARSRQTAVGGGKGGFFQGKGISRSDVVELRREMLIRSHGEGLNQDTFAVQRFETTAMGRRSHGQTVDRTETMRWLPAKTLNGLDRLQRSRMLMGKRPVVTRLRLWA